MSYVAPARERGLKSMYLQGYHYHLRRSREGAWIEIPWLGSFCLGSIRRSREGAWIEMPALSKTLSSLSVAPARERGLKFQYRDTSDALKKRRSREGAWIEMPPAAAVRGDNLVAPARERGLKCDIIYLK